MMSEWGAKNHFKSNYGAKQRVIGTNRCKISLDRAIETICSPNNPIWVCKTRKKRIHGAETAKTWWAVVKDVFLCLVEV